MTPEQRRRARLAVAVPSGYGLGAGIWSVLIPPAPGDTPATLYGYGLLAMYGTLVGAWVLWAVAAVAYGWVMKDYRWLETPAPWEGTPWSKP